MEYNDTFENMMRLEALNRGVSNSMVVYDKSPNNLTVNFIGTHATLGDKKWSKEMGDVTPAELDNLDLASVKEILDEMGI